MEVSPIPKVGLRQTFDLQTRNQYTKVSCEIGMSIDGKELPSMAVLGKALEEAIAMVQERVTESYKVVPERINTPIAPTPVPGMPAEPIAASAPAKPAVPFSG